MMVDKQSSSMFAAVHAFQGMVARGEADELTLVTAAGSFFSREADKFLEVNPNFAGRSALGFLCGNFNTDYREKYASDIARYGGIETTNAEGMRASWDAVIDELTAMGPNCNAPLQRLVIVAFYVTLCGGTQYNNPEDMFPLIEDFLEIEPKNLTPNDGEKNDPSTFFGMIAVLYGFERWYDNKYGIPHSAARSTTANVNQNNSPSSTSNKSGGCYVATAVYGSYDCPEVWTLRRFRDFSLAKSFFGRTFIKIYYAISPALVSWFGETGWFKSFWKRRLDKLVSSLKQQGYEDTPYND